VHLGAEWQAEQQQPQLNSNVKNGSYFSGSGTSSDGGVDARNTNNNNEALLRQQHQLELQRRLEGKTSARGKTAN
jgi:hypothetical protein